jgi:hypothetical protein
MKTSESIAKIAPSLIVAQAAMPAVERDGRNPAFRSRYMTLDGILSTAIPVLTKHGLALVQSSEVTSLDDNFRPMAVTVTSRLVHISGEWVEATATIPIARPDAHGMGSAITYGRRYCVASILGIMADEDDDANASTMAPQRSAPVAVTPRPLAQGGR